MITTGRTCNSGAVIDWLVVALRTAYRAKEWLMKPRRTMFRIAVKAGR